MEPGHEDREEATGILPALTHLLPQWSPVTRTGKSDATGRVVVPVLAAMEPGHEDREEERGLRIGGDGGHAAMEPGHEDREEKSRRRRHQHAGDPAAMEPGHEDREECSAVHKTHRHR